MSDKEPVRAAQGWSAPVRKRLRIAVLVLLATALTVVILHIAPRFWQPTALDGPVGDGGWTARSRAWFVASGFYSPQFEAGTGHPFSWTRKTFRLNIPRLD